MRFLVDAQLPARLAEHLNTAGHDAVHTLSLPSGNRTTDADIVAIADSQSRVVITKDRDFRDSHLLRSGPKKLFIVETGNISNNDLLAIFDKNLAGIVDALETSSFVQLTQDRLILHDDR